MLMLDPNAPEGRGEQILTGVREMIEASGTLIGEHDWGVRRMSFEIRHRPEAHYELYQFEGDKELLQRLEHTLKITDGVLRFRIIRLKPGSPPPPTPRPAEPRTREREPRGSEGVAARAAAHARSAGPPPRHPPPPTRRPPTTRHRHTAPPRQRHVRDANVKHCATNVKTFP